MAVIQSQAATSVVRRVVRFTGGGTWSVPAGVTYAVAHVVGGGGGVGRDNAGNGTTSSVAFPSGTISSGFGRGHTTTGRYTVHFARAGAANSGQGAAMNTEHGNIANDSGYGSTLGGRGPLVTGGGNVTPGGSVAVVVGNGGSAGTSGAAGGSGYVWIEFEQEVFV